VFEGGIKCVLNVVILFSWDNRVIQARFRKGVSIFKDFWAHVLSQDATDKSLIFIISDTTTIVNFSTDIVKHLERYEAIGLDEDLKLAATDGKFLKHESVLDVPANRSELSSVLHNGVEENESPKKLFKSFWFITALEILFFNASVSSQAVKFETGWWLECHFYRVL
jgi:hypothetical protein